MSIQTEKKDITWWNVSVAMVEQLRDELRRTKESLSEAGDKILTLYGQLAQSNKRIEELIRFNDDPSQYHEGLENKLAQTKAENARLAAIILELQRLTNVWHDASDVPRFCWVALDELANQGSTSARSELRDLLAPTIELLRTLEFAATVHTESETVSACPCCYGWSPVALSEWLGVEHRRGHKSDCRLVKELARLEPVIK
jgi:hypothetical protein